MKQGRTGEVGGKWSQSPTELSEGEDNTARIRQHGGCRRPCLSPDACGQQPMGERRSVECNRCLETFSHGEQRHWAGNSVKVTLGIV